MLVDCRRGMPGIHVYRARKALPPEGEVEGQAEKTLKSALWASGSSSGQQHAGKNSLSRDRHGGSCL